MADRHALMRLIRPHTGSPPIEAHLRSTSDQPPRQVRELAARAERYVEGLRDIFGASGGYAGQASIAVRITYY